MRVLCLECKCVMYRGEGTGTRWSLCRECDKGGLIPPTPSALEQNAVSSEVMQDTLFTGGTCGNDSGDGQAQ